MSYGYHLRTGKFGKKEQHMERKFKEYLSDIDEYAGGLMLDVRKFTMKNGTILDSDKIKDAAKKVLDHYEDITDEQEREFYTAYFYCAFVLISVEFKYLDIYSEPREGWYCIYPPFDRKKIPVKKAAETLHPETWAELCLLLGDKWIEIPYDYDFDPPNLSISEEREMNEDMAEAAEALDWDEINRQDAEFYEEMEKARVMSEEEIAEWNQAESNRIKAYYPGYEDFIKYTKEYVELYPKFWNDGFEKRVRSMLEYYILAEGHSIFADEKKYLEVMIHLNRARKLLMKYMGGNI